MGKAEEVEKMAQNFLTGSYPSTLTASVGTTLSGAAEDRIILDFCQLPLPDRARLLRRLALSALPDSYEGLFVPGFAPK